MARRQGRRNTPNGYIEVDGGVTLHHVEVDGCVVNIREGLHDQEGHSVTSVEILTDQYADEKWRLDGSVNNRVIQVC